ncbi:GntR family transcriptional regulator [Eubacterium xylanophilum]|uniref:GntR family transcriptional regulator n=1 Tax=Eubacterium xylanophilum TaxID=39497 RepID=UPI00047ED7E7|nr:GntR family transcriptional regulator [Eubacterium xylanophilum]MCR5797900.1 GntR family transcriptional regulator [Eubacterium sp.]
MVVINHKSDVPLFEQIVIQIKQGWIKGYLSPGDSVPSVRRMAMELQVTPGTVAKAYAELERQGVIETVRGKGTYISERSNSMLTEAEVERLMKRFDDLLIELACLGIDKETIIEKTEKIFKDIK